MPTSPSYSMTPEDEVIFGSLNSLIADHLSEKLEAALADGIASLPQEGSQSLLERCRKVYLKNIDIFELYAARNIFTIASFPPKRRQAIVELYQGNTKDDDELNAMDSDDDDFDDTMASEAELESEIVSKDDIPTLEQLKTRQEETIALQHRLAHTKRQLQLAQAKLDDLSAAEKMLDMASIPNVQQQVSEVVTGAQEIQELQTKCTDLIDDMDQTSSMARTLKRQKGSLDERYEQDKQRVALGALYNLKESQQSKGN